MLSDKQIVGVVLKCVQGVKSMSTKEQTEGIVVIVTIQNDLLNFSDLKAFEQRLTEIVTHVEGSTYKWRSK